MVQYRGQDSASVGIKLPNGTYERPIGKNRLHWVRPGIKGFSQTKAWKLKLPSPCCGSCIVHKRAGILVLFFFFCCCHPQKRLLVYLFKCYFLFLCYNES